MKPVLAFVAGIVIASGIAYVVANRHSEPQPVAVAAPVTSSAGQPSAQANPPQAPVSSPEPVETKPTPVSAPQPKVLAKQTHSSAARPGQVKTASNKMPDPAHAPAAVPVQQTPAPAPTPVREEPRPVVAEAPPPPPVQETPRPQPRQPQTITIPAGTLLTVRVDEALASDRSFQGDQFRATLDQPLIIDHMVIAERGARALGRVVDVDKGGRVKGVAQIGVELISLNTSDGQKIALKTETFQREAQTSRKSDAAKVGAGAGLGAIIGAIAGGGKGAAIGAGVGGAAGAGDVALTRGKPAQIPVETKVSFRLRDSITVTERLHE